MAKQLPVCMLSLLCAQRGLTLEILERDLRWICRLMHILHSVGEPGSPSRCQLMWHPCRWWYRAEMETGDFLQEWFEASRISRVCGSQSSGWACMSNIPGAGPRECVWPGEMEGFDNFLQDFLHCDRLHTSSESDALRSGRCRASWLTVLPVRHKSPCLGTVTQWWCKPVLCQYFAHISFLTSRVLPGGSTQIGCEVATGAWSSFLSGPALFQGHFYFLSI